MASFDVLLLAQANGLRPKTSNVFSPKKNKYKAAFINYKEKHFFFDEHYYSQIDGLALSSPLGPTLANIFK